MSNLHPNEMIECKYVNNFSNAYPQLGCFVSIYSFVLFDMCPIHMPEMAECKYVYNTCKYQLVQALTWPDLTNVQLEINIYKFNFFSFNFLSDIVSQTIARFVTFTNLF